MGKFLFPDEYYDSTYSINFGKLYKQGYRAVLFDIDNTLVPHDAPSDDRAKDLIRRMKKADQLPGVYCGRTCEEFRRQP